MKILVLKSFCVCLLLMFCVSTSVVFASPKININKATAVELVALTGVGEKTAASIVAYRTAHGDFKEVAAIVEVKGIGEKTFAKFAEMITVTDK